jgi:hypothetical protein
MSHYSKEVACLLEVKAVGTCGRANRSQTLTDLLLHFTDKESLSLCEVEVSGLMDIKDWS